jgi:O-acetyl-ADP-ribose deacetylase
MASADIKAPYRPTIGDIMRLKVDAIVNTANASLLGGGGVDGSIHRAAGPRLLAECPKLGDVLRERHGLRGVTVLPASHVIHSFGPIWQGGAAGEQQILASCYLSCPEIARSQGIRDIAFPAIATGVYGFPREAAARVAVTTIGSHLAEQRLLELVIFVCFDTATLNAYRNAVGYGA